MLLVLAKETYECWLVAEDIILLTRKIIYTNFIVSESIYVEKGVGGGGGDGEGGGLCPPRSQRHMEISNEMESFPSYGSRIFFFSLFLRPYYFLVPLMSRFIFFLHIKNQNIFFG